MTFEVGESFCGSAVLMEEVCICEGEVTVPLDTQLRRLRSVILLGQQNFPKNYVRGQTLDK